MKLAIVRSNGVYKVRRNYYHKIYLPQWIGQNVWQESVVLAASSHLKVNTSNSLRRGSFRYAHTDL